MDNGTLTVGASNQYRQLTIVRRAISGITAIRGFPAVILLEDLRAPNCGQFVTMLTAQARGTGSGDNL